MPCRQLGSAVIREGMTSVKLSETDAGVLPCAESSSLTSTLEKSHQILNECSWRDIAMILMEIVRSRHAFIPGLKCGAFCGAVLWARLGCIDKGRL